MKIEFNLEEIKDLLIDKANVMVGGPMVASVQFNQVEFKAGYGYVQTATVFYEKPEVANEAVEQS